MIFNYLSRIVYFSFYIEVPFLVGLLYGQVKVVLKSFPQTQYIKQIFVDQILSPDSGARVSLKQTNYFDFEFISAAL